MLRTAGTSSYEEFSERIKEEDARVEVMFFCTSVEEEGGEKGYAGVRFIYFQATNRLLIKRVRSNAFMFL